MKKFMALSIAAVMVLFTAGCDPKPAETTMADITAATEIAADTSVTDITAAESAAGIVVSGKKYVINIDTTFTPLEFRNEKGEMVGTNLDILEATAQDQGFEYGVIPVGFSTARIALESGECDGVIADMSIIDEKIQKCDFSEPYCDSGVGMVVLSGSDITTYDQLKGQNVAAKIGVEECTFTESIADQYDSEVTQYESSSDVYQAVPSDEVITYFENYPVVGYEISRGLELTFPIDMEKGSSYGLVTLKGVNPELVDMFSKEPENIKTNGKYEEILNTYIVK